MEEILRDYGAHSVKLVVALFLGILLGLERQKSGKTAGIKTHGLVSMGSALFVIVSIMVSDMFVVSTIFDPLRMASHVIVGVGFIGGGAIMVRGESISGLTSAANLWLAAGIGMATGFGFYPLAILVTVMALMVFLIASFIDKKTGRRLGDQE